MGIFRRRPRSVIDLRDHVLARERQAVFAFGFPTRCPACGRGGYLDHIDLFRKVQHEHCPRCGIRWERSEAEVEGLNV